MCPPAYGAPRCIPPGCRLGPRPLSRPVAAIVLSQYESRNSMNAWFEVRGCSGPLRLRPGRIRPSASLRVVLSKQRVVTPGCTIIGDESSNGAEVEPADQ